MLWVLIRIDSNEYPQRIFLWRNRENYPLIITEYPLYLFYWTEAQLWACDIKPVSRFLAALLQRHQAARLFLRVQVGWGNSKTEMKLLPVL